ncbi:hypothetical protein [Dactylosporangium sp. CS-033363]|uniref:hypothetical protein n=1 Tax=Dactylosporangium sp. CS-033363 TaxID=3239935 RepID=UPI003D92F8A8
MNRPYALPVLVVLLAFVAGAAASATRVAPASNRDAQVSEDFADPGWATDPVQRPREVTMEVALDGRADHPEMTIAYEVRLGVGDPLLKSVPDGPSLGRYLAGGPVNLPVTVERSGPTGPGKLRFGYTGREHRWVSLGDRGLLSPAARATTRWLTVRTGPAVLIGVRPAPNLQQARFAAITGSPVGVDLTLADDEAGADAMNAPASPSGFVAGWLRAVFDRTAWLIVVLVPGWVLVARVRRVRDRFAEVVRAAGVAVAVLAGLAWLETALLSLPVPIMFRLANSDLIELDVVVGLAVPLAAAGAVFAARRRDAEPAEPPRSGTAVLLIGAGSLGAGAVAMRAATGTPAGSGAWAGPAAMLLLLLFPAAVAGFEVGRWRGVAAVLWTAGLAAFVGAGGSWLALPNTLRLTLAGLAAAGSVALAVPLPLWARAGVLLGGLASVPVLLALADLPTFLVFYQASTPTLATPLARLVAVGLGAAALVHLHKAGRWGRALGSRSVLAAALALAVIAATDPFPFGPLHVAAVLWLVVAWRWLVPVDERLRAAGLASVGAERHRELVGAELRRRLAAVTAFELFRRAPGKLGAGEDQLARYERAQLELDEAAWRPAATSEITVADAFSTGGGRAPWANAVRAFGYALPIGLLFAGYELFAILAPVDAAELMPYRTVADLVAIGAHLGRWFVYALLFGYLYPLLRGDNPVAKAAAFGVALLGVEVLPILDLPAGGRAESSVLDPASGKDLAIAVLIRAGQLVMLLGGLALLWERWLTRAAGYSWDRVRNVRSVRSLAAPVGTILVSVLTTAGTALAGAAVAGLLSTGPGPAADPPGGSPPAATPK